MNILTLPVSSLREYENNPRLIGDEAVQSMAQLIQTHGFRVPVLVRSLSDGDAWQLVDGHLRIRAARQVGLEEVPAIDVSDMGEDAVKSFRIAVNRAAEFAEWDYDRLVEEVSALSYEGDDLLAHIGMTDEALSSLMEEPEAAVAGDTAHTGSAHMTREQSADPDMVRSPTDQVTLSLRMTLADRDDALERLDALKHEYGVDTRAAVFLRLLAPAPDKKARPRTRRKA